MGPPPAGGRASLEAGSGESRRAGHDARRALGGHACIRETCRFGGVGDGFGAGDDLGVGDRFGAGARFGGGDGFGAGDGFAAEGGVGAGAGGAFFFGGANSGRISDRFPVPPLILRVIPSPLPALPEKLARVEPARSVPFRRWTVSPSVDRSTVTSTGRPWPSADR